MNIFLSQKKRLHILLTALCLWPIAAQSQPPAWQSNWAIPPGYFLEIDSSGYTLPVTIALVPNPSPAPEAPAYYVAELGGRILAVRNDRKVEVFAEKFFDLNLNAQMPDLAGVLGLTGLCLDAATGYLFATYVYDAEDGRYNGITRFSTSPDSFALRPSQVLHIRKPLKLGDSAFTRYPFGHQIGQCQVIDDTLYVGTGDGELSHRPRSLQSSFGKILHMQLDGSPVVTAKNEPLTVASYVYARGLRNPFGQTLAGEKIIVADNGPGVDRVLNVTKGSDYLYDGSDASIATNAMVLLAPAKGTANISFYPENFAGEFPELENNLLIVLSGVPEKYVEEEPAEISFFEIDPKSSQVLSRPRSLVKHVGQHLQVLSSVAIAKDGIYFAPVYSEASTASGSNVYRLSKAADKQYPTRLGHYRNGRAIIRDNGCRGCHSILGDGGNIGPALDATLLKTRNLTRLNSSQYTALLTGLNSKDNQKTSVAARNRILSVKGEQRLRAWVEEKILEPTLDNAHSIMPSLNLSRQEAKDVTRFLLREKKQRQ